MCTVTVIRLPHDPARAGGGRSAPGWGGRPRGGIRVASNRDELRSRAPGLAPEVRGFGSRRAMMPIDPVSGGTWIAVNDAGLAMTLLNANFAQPVLRRASGSGAGKPAAGRAGKATVVAGPTAGSGA